MSESVPAQPRIRPPFEALGGEAGVRRLVDAFYDAVDGDPAAADLRRMHGADLAPMRERLTDWLIGWMGGPKVYAERHPGRPCVMSAHAGLEIGPVEADQWVGCMRQAMAKVGVPADWRGALELSFTRMCQAMRTT